MENSSYVDKENIAERLERLHDKIEGLKGKALADGETNWSVGGAKTHQLDCSQPGSDVLGVESAALELRKVLASVDGPHGLAASLSGEGAAAAAAQRNAKQATQALEVATALEAVAGLGAGLEALDVHLHQRQFLAAAESLVALEARLAHLQEQADNALALQAAHQQQQQQPDGSTSSSEALDAVAGAAPLSRLVGLCANQTKVRRAELKGALASLWRFAVRAHPVLASDDTVAESNESYSAGAAAAAPAVSTVLLHSSLEGLCGGIQLDQSLPIGDLRRALEIIGDGSAEDLVLESVAALQTHVLIPLCEHAQRDLKALPSSSSAPGAFAFVSAVRADTAAVTGATGDSHTLVFAPPLPPQQASSTGDHPDDANTEESSPSAAASSLAVGRARRVNVPLDGCDDDGMSPAAAAELAAQQRAAQLPARLQRVQVLLRDLFAVLDFTCATLLGGSLRYAAKAGARLFADPEYQEDLSSSTTQPTGPSSNSSSSSGGPARAAEAGAALLAVLTGSNATDSGNSTSNGNFGHSTNGNSSSYGHGDFMRALGEAVEAVSGGSGSTNSWACLPPLPAELKALRTALGDLEQRLFELGLLADLPNTSGQERRALEAADQADSLADSSEEVVGSSGQLFLASATGSTSTTGSSSSSGKGRALRPPASPLSCLGARLPARWASSARAKLLAQARVRMLAADYHNSVPSSDALSLSGCLGSGNDSASSSPLAFPTCQVTSVCLVVLKSAHEALHAACANGLPALASATLYRAARELLDLFRAVVPQRHSEALTTLPRLAALFHNDCLLLAHACLGPLVHAYRHKLPAPLNRSATCVDLAPALRSLGEQALLRQLAVQQVQLDEFLKGVVWVPDDEDEEEGSDEEGEAAAIAAAGSSASSPEQAIAQCLFHLHHLANLWQPVLSPEVYRACLGRLLRHATAPLASALVASTAVAETTTHRLHAILSDLLRAHAALFGSTPATSGLATTDDVSSSEHSNGFNNSLSSNTNDVSSSNREVSSSLEASLESIQDSEGWQGAWWRRLVALRGLLVWRLDEIAEQLGRGALVDFSAAELGHLLEALFEDGDKLRRLLAAVRQA